MTTPRGTFKRMMLNLPPSAGDYGAVRTAAELSELLGADLIATFLEDPSLLELSALQCARELRTVERGWRPLDEAQLAHDFRRAAATARRLFAETVRSCSIEASFEVVRGSAMDVATAAQSDDIVVLIEPKDHVERITQHVTSFAESAFKAASAVMVIPSRVSRKRGPVVSLATMSDDPSIAAGMTIARAMNERLVVLNTAGRAVSMRDLDEAVQASRGWHKDLVLEAPIQASMLFAALAGLNERLLVVPRGSLDWRAAQMMASLRSIPVLVTETQGASAEVDQQYANIGSAAH